MPMTAKNPVELVPSVILFILLPHKQTLGHLIESAVNSYPSEGQM